MHERERLTDAELKIMHVLWARASLTMPEVTKALAAETGWTRHTVIGLLKRMIEKGTVRVEEGDVLKMVSNIVDGGALDDAELDGELDALSRMLDEVRRREKEKGSGR